MPIAGSVWIEGNDLHWLDSGASEKNMTFTDTGANPPGAVIGSMWVEGNYLHYIDASGNERREQGTLVAAQTAVNGSIWIDTDDCIHYIDASSNERKHCVGCSGTIDCAALNVCQSGGNPGCNTLKGCTPQGERHRVQWSHTGCDANCEIQIDRSVNGGAFTQVQDGVACCPADPDSGCCEFIKGGCADDCNVMYTFSKSSDLGSCTTSYQYKVILQTAGTDTTISSATTGSGTGCNTDCIA